MAIAGRRLAPETVYMRGSKESSAGYQADWSCEACRSILWARQEPTSSGSFMSGLTLVPSSEQAFLMNKFHS